MADQQQTGLFWPCPRCQTPNAAGAARCRSCGLAIPSGLPPPRQGARQRAEEQARLDAFDWSFCESEDLVYGERSSDGFVVLPRSWLEVTADMHAALAAARTWGDLRALLDAASLDEAVERSRILEEEPYEGAAFSSVPDDEGVYVAAVEEGLWPSNPAHDMGGWMSQAVLEEFGVYESGMLDDGWWVISDIERLLPWLERAGATCERDDVLVRRATWG